MQVELGSYLFLNLLDPDFAQPAFVGCLGVRVAIQFMGQAQPQGFKVVHGTKPKTTADYVDSNRCNSGSGMIQNA